MIRSHPEKQPRRNAEHNQPGNDKRSRCNESLINLTLRSKFHNELPAWLDAEFLALRIVPDASMTSRFLMHRRECEKARRSRDHQNR